MRILTGGLGVTTTEKKRKAGVDGAIERIEAAIRADELLRVADAIAALEIIKHRLISNAERNK